MPFFIRRHVAGRTQVISKRGMWEDQELAGKRTRLYSNMGALKNSVSQWRGTADDDAEIVEVELRETGKVLLVGEVMDPVRERREAKIAARKLQDQIRTKEREIAELKRLKSKYEG
jgi:hypothetical protein